MTAKSLSLIVLAGLASGCVAPADPGLDSARATIQMLGGTIGVRPAGSEADARARDFIATALRAAGLTVRIQHTDAVRPEAGVTARVDNIIATRDEADRTAIALVSHYDSVPDGPGAQDDALGVATCLAAARELLAAPLRHSLMVIVTDGEEIGLMGARAVASDPDVRARVRAFLNFDGTGGTGPPVLFQAGPGWGDTLTAWARGAWRPFGGSFAVEIYRRLPNDTDFTVLSAAGISGLNFAPVGDSYVYHTDRDRPGGVADETIVREIANTVGTVRALDKTTLDRVNDEPTYFDVGNRVALVYGHRATLTLGTVGILFGFLGWVLLTRELVSHGIPSLVRSALRAIVLSLTAFGSMAAATDVLRTVRHESTPWYAWPWLTFGGLASMGCLAIWIGTRLWPAPRVTASQAAAPARVLWATLPVWMGLSAFLLFAAPGASYLVALPLLVVGVCVSVSRKAGWLRTTAALLWVVVLLLWAQDLMVLLGFLVPLFGWLSIGTPVWLFAAILTLAGVIILPPLIGVGAGSAWVERRSTSVGAIWAVLTLVFAVASCRAAAYTDDRPARRSLRYVQDDLQHHAWWEIGGSDLGLVPASGAPTGTAWMEARGPIAASVNLTPLPTPLVFRSAGSPSVVAPADVQSTLARGADGLVTLSVRLAPRALIAATLMLPRGVLPTKASLDGVVVGGQWRATYAVVPNEGVEFRVDVGSQATLAGTLLLLTETGVPSNGSISGQLPFWLPRGPATWQARSIFLVPVIPEG